MLVTKRNKKAGEFIVKKNFDILKKQTRFYIFIILLVTTICGFIFKGVYTVQYNETLHNMQNEPKYTSQLHIYEYQVEEEIMKEKGVMFLDITKNIAYILITLGGLLTAISGFFCILTLVNGNQSKGCYIDTSNTSPSVECPYCHSMNTSKIGTVNRMVSTSMFGLASKKIGKQWHCNKCGSDF